MLITRIQPPIVTSRSTNYLKQAHKSPHAIPGSGAVAQEQQKETEKLLFFIHLLVLDLLFLALDDLIVAHGGQDDDHVGLLAGVLEEVSDFTGEVVRVLRELDVLAGVTVGIHEGDEAVLGDIQQGELFADNERNIGVVGGRNDIFVLLASEDVDGSEVALGVTVLSSLGGGDVGHLAREALDADVTVGKNKKQQQRDGTINMRIDGNTSRCAL